MNCRHIEILLQEYLAGELPEKKAKEFEEHLSHCARCRQKMEDARLTKETLGSLKKVRASEDFLHRLHQRIDTEIPKKAAWNPTGPAMRALAALIIAIPVLFLIVTQRPWIKEYQQPVPSMEETSYPEKDLPDEPEQEMARPAESQRDPVRAAEKPTAPLQRDQTATGDDGAEKRRQAEAAPSVNPMHDEDKSEGANYTFDRLEEQESALADERAQQFLDYELVLTPSAPEIQPQETYRTRNDKLARAESFQSATDDANETANNEIEDILRRAGAKDIRITADTGEYRVITYTADAATQQRIESMLQGRYRVLQRSAPAPDSIPVRARIKLKK